MSRRRRLLWLWACVVLGLAVRAFGRGTVGEISALPIRVAQKTINLNLASVADLRVLPGIGSVRAEAIVLERVRNGPFRGIEDLVRVDGIGPETVAELQPFVCFGDSGHGWR